MEYIGLIACTIVVGICLWYVMTATTKGFEIPVDDDSEETIQKAMEQVVKFNSRMWKLTICSVILYIVNLVSVIIKVVG